MRVIAGSARGTRLEAPPGHVTRPTSDLTKEALFSMIAPFAPFPRVLDLYAGSGALGIEALSRWGGHATFVEADSRVCRVLLANLARTHLVESATVVRRPVGPAVRELSGPFHLVLADPPYDDPAVAAILERVGARGVVALDGVVVLEHAARRAPAARYGTLTFWKSRRHGDTELSFYVPVVGESVMSE